VNSVAPLKIFLSHGSMQADFSVELGADDDCLEVPWASADGALRYFDLKRRPELLLEIAETHENRELAEFLSALNSANSVFETAKCDTWASNEIAEEEEIFGAPWKFGSYVDIIFTDVTEQLSLARHEEFAKTISHLLSKAPDFAAAVEFVIRRCFYHSDDTHATSDVELDAPQHREGFGITVYCYGYGDDAAEAKQRWVIGLKVVQNALLQVSARQKDA
jgi:hypothetical protein